MPDKKPHTRSIQGRKAGLFWLPPHFDDQVSDGDGESDSSAGDSGLSWDYPALEEGHPLFVIEAAITDAVIGAFRIHQNGTGKQQGTEENSASNSFTPTAPTHIGQGSSGKRKLAPCRQDGDESPSTESTQKKARTAPRRLTFACPFCKKDPLRYRPCYSPPRRTRQSRTCPTRPVVVFDGVTDEQKQLLARRFSSRHCEEDQWYTVFDILFAGHSHPSSPYIDQQLSEEMHVFRDFMASEGPRIMRQHMEPHVSWLSSDADTDMDTFQDHIIGQCLQRLFEEWERAATPESSGEGTDSGTPPSVMASITNRPEERITPMDSHAIKMIDVKKSEGPDPAPKVPAYRVQKQEQQRDKTVALVKELAAMRKKMGDYETTIDILNCRLVSVKGEHTSQAERIKTLHSHLQECNKKVQDWASSYEETTDKYLDNLEAHRRTCNEYRDLWKAWDKDYCEVRLALEESDLSASQKEVQDLQATVRQLRAQIARDDKEAVKAALSEVQQFVASIKRKA
ncbi:hypothetical protein GE09DRAFT_1217324 [Coniochaeta sp. 2T2.1]|nr:hypothetical protein GE09DRAFT_1217324 [Coniochaeta sp. 2T2.1]